MREQARHQESMMISISEFKPKLVQRGKTEDIVSSSMIAPPKVDFKLAKGWMTWLQNFREFISVNDEDSDDSVDQAIRLSRLEKPLYVPSIP